MRKHALPIALSILVSCAAQAQLWVSSNFNHEVLQYDPATGNVLAGQPLIPAARGALDQPHGIIDRRAGVLVASFGTHEVKRYHRTSGAFIDNFIPATAGLNAPVYLAIGPNDGLLYVSSQGNDRLLRFNLETGAAIDGSPYVNGGALDGPSGFGWSPDGSILYIAGRYSANVLAYEANSGTPLIAGHVFAGGLGAGNTFGLAVDPASGDVFVATSGAVQRFSSAGALRATISLPGAIGLENGPDGTSIFAAANNNLYRIAKSNNAVTGPLLTGPSINVLNFFHFSRVTGPQVGPLSFTVREAPPGEHRFEFSFSLSALTSGSTATIQSSTDLDAWDDGAVYTMVGQSLRRDASPETVAVSQGETGGAIQITERGSGLIAGGGNRFFQVEVEGK